VRDKTGRPARRRQLSVQVECADGSIGTVLYVASGDAAMPKERVEVLGRGRSAVLENYQSLTTWAGNKKKEHKALSVDKGHAEQVARWVKVAGRAGAAADRVARAAQCLVGHARDDRVARQRRAGHREGLTIGPVPGALVLALAAILPGWAVLAFLSPRIDRAGRAGTALALSPILGGALVALFVKAGLSWGSALVSILALSLAVVALRRVLPRAPGPDMRGNGPDAAWYAALACTLALGAMFLTSSGGGSAAMPGRTRRSCARCACTGCRRRIPGTRATRCNTAGSITPGSPRSPR
jgi:hypothetical protein